MNERGRQCDPLALTARQLPNWFVVLGDAQTIEHGARFIFGYGAVFGGQTIKHLLQHGCIGTHVGILRHIGHLYIGKYLYGAAVRFFGSRQYAEQGGFSRTVDADNTDFILVVQIQRSVLNQLFHSIIFFDVFGC